MRNLDQKRFFLIYIFALFLLFFEHKPISSKNKSGNFVGENILLGEINNNFRPLKNSYKSEKEITDFNKILLKERDNFHELFATVFLENEFDGEKKLLIDIESDIQSTIGNILTAEGNVIISSNDLILKADKVIYDKDQKLFFAEGNVIFKKNNQYLQANILEFNFQTKKGFLEEAYGLMDFANLDQDLNINSQKRIPIKNSSENKDLINLPSQVELLGSQNLRLKSKLNSSSIDFDFATIQQWRFKSKKITIEDQILKSNLIFFTNDPFNPAQFVIKSKNFSGEIINDKSVFKSSSTTLILDNKIFLPAGSRRIAERNEYLRWGIGYDATDKDGLYILRNFNPIYIGDNFDLDFTPQFLLQRAIIGETNSFRLKDSSVTSKNITNSNIEISDYFSLNTTLSGEINKWDLLLKADLKTFNTDRFYDALSTDLNLTKNIFTKEINSLMYGPEIGQNDNFYSKLTLDLGLYAAFEKEDIYTALGSKLISNYSSSNFELDKNYDLILDLGTYQGKSLADDTELISLDRYGLITSLEHKYKLFGKISEDKLTRDYKNSPEIVNEGLHLKTKLGYGIYQYNNGKGQSILTAGIGPEFVRGQLKNKFLDYTSLSIFPEYIFKKGSSPFKFDDFNSSARIVLSLKQQLIGPLILGLETNYNIDTKSSGYGSFENKNLSLGISRRAYAAEFVYDQDNKSVAFQFKVFNFGYNDRSDKF